MKKRLLACLLAFSLLTPVLSACHNSGTETAAVSNEAIGYDPEEAVKDFEFGELNDTEKNYTIEVGYNNCDHMVACIIAQEAGIYDALGLKVNLTKTAEIINGLSSGQMDAGYQGVEGSILAANQGAPIFMAAANHLGGSRYFVASNDIQDPSDLEGKTLAITAEGEIDPEWITWSNKLGIPNESSAYNVVSMGQQDAMFALKAGQIDGFTC